MPVDVILSLSRPECRALTGTGSKSLVLPAVTRLTQRASVRPLASSSTSCRLPGRDRVTVSESHGLPARMMTFVRPITSSRTDMLRLVGVAYAVSGDTTFGDASGAGAGPPAGS